MGFKISNMILRIGATLAVATLLGGCHYLGVVREPIGARARIAEAGPPRDCLMVLLPGIGDRATELERRGLLEHAPAGCDVTVVDAHFTYYLTQQVTERVAQDVLARARGDGYREIWLVGFSLGGYGAMLVAREHPELVDGVVLLAPLLGVPPRARDAAGEVVAAGGLHRWRGLDEDAPAPLHHFREPRIVWDWLRDGTIAPVGPPVVLAYGTDDPRAPHYEVVADALPSTRVFRAEGGHDWATWRALWARVLRDGPWSTESERPRLARGGP